MDQFDLLIFSRGDWVKIGDFVKLAQVSVRMLRYYDKVGLLKLERVDPYTRYRFYSIKQLPAIRKIVMLRNLDLVLLKSKKSFNTGIK